MLHYWDKQSAFPFIFFSDEKDSTVKFAEFSFQNKCYHFAVLENAFKCIF